MRALDAETRLCLLQLARASIGEALRADGRLARLRGECGLQPGALAPRGTFVTLRERNAGPGPRPLRGCIGCVASRLPLDESVIDLARQAALADPRFPPLTADDLPRVLIEISLLGPLVKISGPTAIEIGRHGVQLRSGAMAAVFLPQVAVEHRWDSTRLVEQLSRKAGLPDHGWKEAELQRFEAEVFGEADTA